MVRRYTGNEKVWVGWTLDDEREVEVQVEVTPGYPGRGPSFSDGGQPPEPPEISVLAVRDEHKMPVPDENDLYATIEADRSFYDRAVEAAGDKNQGDYEDACERESEARRERDYDTVD